MNRTNIVLLISMLITDIITKFKRNKIIFKDYPIQWFLIKGNLVNEKFPSLKIKFKELLSLIKIGLAGIKILPFIKILMITQKK